MPGDHDVAARACSTPRSTSSAAPIDLHSGGFGGAVQNPANALARIITELKADDGTRPRPGLLRRRRPADEARSASRSAACRSTRRSSSKITGVPELVAGEPGFTLLECMGIRPTLDVNGIWGGFTGEGSKTIIPAHAHAKVSCRLVPGPGRREAVRAVPRLRARGRAEGRARSRSRTSARRKPLRTDPDHPVAKAAARALEATFGQAPVFIRSGGSIPVAAMFESRARAAGRHARLHESGRQRACPERDDGPLEL